MSRSRISFCLLCMLLLLSTFCDANNDTEQSQQSSTTGEGFQSDGHEQEEASKVEVQQDNSTKNGEIKDETKDDGSKVEVDEGVEVQKEEVKSPENEEQNKEGVDEIQKEDVAPENEDKEAGAEVQKEEVIPEKENKEAGADGVKSPENEDQAKEDGTEVQKEEASPSENGSKEDGAEVQEEGSSPESQQSFFSFHISYISGLFEPENEDKIEGANVQKENAESLVNENKEKEDEVQQEDVKSAENEGQIKEDGSEVQGEDAGDPESGSTDTTAVASTPTEHSLNGSFNNQTSFPPNNDTWDPTSNAPPEPSVLSSAPLIGSTDPIEPSTETTGQQTGPPSKETKSSAQTTTTTVAASTESSGNLFLIGVIIFLVLLLIAIFVCCCMLRKKNPEDDKDLERQDLASDGGSSKTEGSELGKKLKGAESEVKTEEKEEDEMETALGVGTGTELFSYAPGSEDTAISVKEKTAVEVSKRLGSGSAAGGRVV
uniref:Uncharacterized protein n=1 Tax=Meloidogyne enterolobii TaxID=390850 RepID=A0A6V7UPL9_MELEN|nr:unnamed protein product [Meloidogyne enterolobii]